MKEPSNENICCQPKPKPPNIGGINCMCLKDTCCSNIKHEMHTPIEEELQPPPTKKINLIKRPIRNNPNNVVWNDIPAAAYMSRSKLRTYPHANASNILSFEKIKEYLGRETVTDGPKHSSLRTFCGKITQSSLDDYF